MLLDFEVQRSTRRCAATDQTLEPGDQCYSVLESTGNDVVRKDYSCKAWTGPPENAFGWWRSRIPDLVSKKLKLAPNDVLLKLFDHLSEDPRQADMRYVLALLLVRRRVFRLEIDTDALNAAPVGDVKESGGSDLSVYCPKRNTNYRVATIFPSDHRINEIQQHLSELLIAGAE